MVNSRRVVVTGLGVISSIGIGKEEFWKALLNGRSGISRVETFDTSNYDTHMGGEVKIFRAGDFLAKKELRRYGRASQFAISATQLALLDSGLDLNVIKKVPVSVCLGTTMADAPAIEAFDDSVASGRYSSIAIRRWALQYPSCMFPTQVAKKFEIKGHVTMIPTACSAGNYAIAYGSDLIRLSKCDIAIVGGVDPFSRIAFTGFNRIFAVAPDQCQPFDRNRKGMIVGEGAGLLILESLQHALGRKATIYAEVKGYGTSCDAYHMTIPSTAGVVQAMEAALKDADIRAEEVDYISAHGTGTPANDKTECAAISKVFKSREKPIPVSSIKSMLGHTMGAASALEAIACSLAVKHNEVPPTINFATPDPECSIDCVPNRSRKLWVDTALNNSFAFGGNNICVVFKKYSQDQSQRILRN